jgi:enoyl-CoA hydratase/carnithine racemase
MDGFPRLRTRFVRGKPVPLEITARSGWTELVLNEPPRNVLDRTMLTALVDALDSLAAADAPLLLLRANGRHFSTGYSITEIPEDIFHHDPHVRAADPFEQVMDRLTHYPAPIVAAVQGDAYGGAVELLACCDLRVAADTVRLGVPPVRLGLVYSHTGLRRMIRGFGSPLVREMLLTGEAVTADRAFHVGFFNRLVPTDELQPTAVRLLETLAKGGPQALRGTRRILTLLEEAEVLSDDALAEIAQLRHDSWSSEEFERARDAFVKKTPWLFSQEGTVEDTTE